jgi:hypothetical protein
MKSDLAIAALIRSRMTELGLSRGEFAKRLGYKNIAKGIRRIDVLCDGAVAFDLALPFLGVTLLGFWDFAMERDDMGLGSVGSRRRN